MIKLPYIQFKNVSKKYRFVQALDEVSFEIKKGDIFGYIGPNGAGKTTSIKILVGLIKNYEGEVLIDGNHVSKTQNNISSILGYMPQEVGFQEWRTCEHALRTFGRLSGMTPDIIEKRIDEVLELVQLHDVRKRKIVHLSGGMVQKLRLAQSLIHNPKLLVLDEPMSGLDPTSRFQLRQIIRELAKEEITIFFSSHILSDVQDIASTIGIINQGHILKVGSPEQLQADFRVGNEIEIITAENSVPFGDLKSIQGVSEIMGLSSNKILVRLSTDIDIDICIQDIIKFLLNRGCKVRNFNLNKPNLEELYLKYVEEDQR